jgi:hypothetical protein
VTSDSDIIRAAKLLIYQHGEDAPLRAAERADDLLEAGDMTGATTWRRVLAALEELRRGRRDGEPVNQDLRSGRHLVLPVFTASIPLPAWRFRRGFVSD